MATISHKDIIQVMLDNDGKYPGDPQAASIWEYKHAITDEVLWAVYWNDADVDLWLSPYVGSYVCLWSRGEGLMHPLGTLV